VLKGFTLDAQKNWLNLEGASRWNYTRKQVVRSRTFEIPFTRNERAFKSANSLPVNVDGEERNKQPAARREKIKKEAGPPEWGGLSICRLNGAQLGLEGRGMYKEVVRQPRSGLGLKRITDNL